MFKHPMKKILAEKYGAAYAAEIMKKSRTVYRQLVERAVDIGDGNPMAYNAADCAGDDAPLPARRCFRFCWDCRLKIKCSWEYACYYNICLGKVAASYEPRHLVA